MKPVDFAKAAGIAAAVLIVDIVLAIGVVFAWSILVAPGHDRAFYATAGIPIALLSTRIMGTALIFAACAWAARRNPQRNALLFALMVAVCYALFDGASIAFKDFLTLGFGITIALKLVAAIAGALVGRRFASLA